MRFPEVTKDTGAHFEDLESFWFATDSMREEIVATDRSTIDGWQKELDQLEALNKASERKKAAPKDKIKEWEKLIAKEESLIAVEDDASCQQERGLAVAPLSDIALFCLSENGTKQGDDQQAQPQHLRCHAQS
jgi:hypothetical protein